MSKRFSTILCASLFVLAAFAHNVEAQNTLPAVEIYCEASNVNINVYPGSNALGFTKCTVSNPTLYQEEVEITVLSDGLPNTGSGKVNIGPGGEVEIQLSFKAEIGMLAQASSWSAEAVVVSANGVPPPNNASSKVQGIVQIMQYSDLSIISTESAIDVNAGSSFEVEILVENLGNQMDYFGIGLKCNRDCDLEDEGFVGIDSGFKKEINPMSNGAQAQSIVFEITAPDKVGKVDSFYFEFYATSEFSCRYEGMCNTEYTSVIVSLSEDGSETFSDYLSGNTVMIIGAIIGTMVVAAVVVVLVRKNTSKDIFEMSEEYNVEELDDEIEEDDFEDDLDDDFFDDL